MASKYAFLKSQGNSLKIMPQHNKHHHEFKYKMLPKDDFILSLEEMWHPIVPLSSGFVLRIVAWTSQFDIKSSR